MRILLISSNALFAETLENSCLKAIPSEVVHIIPANAPNEIITNVPEIIMVDESDTSPEQLSSILEASRCLPGSHTILLNLENNDVVVLNARRTTIKKIEDLAKIMQTNNKEQQSKLALEAENRADAFGFFATLCNQRPDQKLVRRLRTLGVESLLNQSDREGAQEETQRGLQEMHSFIQEIADRSDEQVVQTLAVDWTRLFRGVSPGYGPPPPYESLYLGENEIKILQAVSRCYHEAGVVPAEEANNRPDYLGLELDFLRYLCEQQAEAWQKGEAEKAQKWEQTENEFLNNHLGRWLPAYFERVIEEAQTAFYRGCVRLTKQMISESIERESHRTHNKKEACE